MIWRSPPYFNASEYHRRPLRRREEEELLKENFPLGDVGLADVAVSSFMTDQFCVLQMNHSSVLFMSRICTNDFPCTLVRIDLSFAAVHTSGSAAATCGMYGHYNETQQLSYQITTRIKSKS